MGRQMILIAQDGTYYDTSGAADYYYDLVAEKEVSHSNGDIKTAIAIRATDDLKVQLKVGDDWVTAAEYDSAEELCYALDCYHVKKGFQPRFKFPERGFYKKYCASADD